MTLRFITRAMCERCGDDYPDVDGGGTGPCVWCYADDVNWARFAAPNIGRYAHLPSDILVNQWCKLLHGDEGIIRDLFPASLLPHMRPADAAQHTCVIVELTKPHQRRYSVGDRITVHVSSIVLMEPAIRPSRKQRGTWRSLRPARSACAVPGETGACADHARSAR